MNISFEGLLTWVSEQGKSLILVAAIVFALILAFKRQFIGAIGTFVVLLLVYAFVARPTLLGDISEFATGLIGIK